MSNSENDDAITVLYIGAVSRSGSTLLDSIMSHIPGFWSTGEMKFLWNRGLDRNELCGCERPFRECDFWQEVLERLRDRGLDEPLSRQGSRVQSVTRHGNVPALLIPFLRTRPFQQRIVQARRTLYHLYRSVKETAGCDVIVDSSKFPAYALLLSGMDEVDFRLLHLVRDPRGVANSWQKTKKRPEIHWKDAYFSKYRAQTISLAWDGFNLAIENFHTENADYTRMKYENVADRPKPCLRQSLDNLGFSSVDLSFLRDRTLTMENNHTVSGNPVRFKRGEMSIDRDDDWKDNLSWFDRYTTVLMTLPLLLGYGYSPSA